MLWIFTLAWSFFITVIFNDQWFCFLTIHIWGLSCQKQVSQAGISNCIPQNIVGCNYISLPEIPGDKVVISQSTCRLGIISHDNVISSFKHNKIWQFHFRPLFHCTSHHKITITYYDSIRNVHNKMSMSNAIYDCYERIFTKYTSSHWWSINVIKIAI